MLWTQLSVLQERQRLLQYVELPSLELRRVRLDLTYCYRTVLNTVNINTVLNLTLSFLQTVIF